MWTVHPHHGDGTAGVDSLCCPHCGLRLSIDRAKSMKAMQALAKVEAAQRRVEKTSKFNGRY